MWEKYEFQLLAELDGRDWVYDSFTQETIKLGQGRQTSNHRRFAVAIYANMILDRSLAPFSLPPLDLGVPGVHWDPSHEGSILLDRWRDEGLSAHWGMLFRSEEALPNLRRELRKRLMVTLPDGRRAVFRFFDPRLSERPL